MERAPSSGHRYFPLPASLSLRSNEVRTLSGEFLHRDDGADSNRMQVDSCACGVPSGSRMVAVVGAIVADEFHTSDWMGVSTPTEVQVSFFSSLHLRNLPNTNLFSFYLALVDRMTGLDSTGLTGAYSIQKNKRITLFVENTWPSAVFCVFRSCQSTHLFVRPTRLTE